MKWRRGTFKVKYINGLGDVDGYVSDIFGIRKYGRVGYCITHLLSGLSPCSKTYKTLKEAKTACVRFTEILPIEQWKTEEPYSEIMKDSEASKLAFRKLMRAA